MPAVIDGSRTDGSVTIHKANEFSTSKDAERQSDSGMENTLQRAWNFFIAAPGPLAS